MGTVTPLSLEEEAVTLRYQFANAEALHDEMVGRLAEAKAEAETAWDSTYSLLSAIRTAHGALSVSKDSASTVEMRYGMSVAIEALGRILDPPSEDFGEVQ